jgi:hypothetical protein
VPPPTRFVSQIGGTAVSSMPSTNNPRSWLPSGSDRRVDTSKVARAKSAPGQLVKWVGVGFETMVQPSTIVSAEAGVDVVTTGMARAAAITSTIASFVRGVEPSHPSFRWRVLRRRRRNVRGCRALRECRHPLSHTEQLQSSGGLPTSTLLHVRNVPRVSPWLDPVARTPAPAPAGAHRLHA